MRGTSCICRQCYTDGGAYNGDDETDMTDYLETWRRALEDRGMRTSIPKTQFIEFKFGQDNGQGRQPVKIIGEELQRVHRCIVADEMLSICSG